MPSVQQKTNVLQSAHDKAQGIVARRFRYTERHPLSSRDRELVEGMRGVALEAVEIMLQMDMDAYQLDRPILGALPRSGGPLRGQYTPESFVQGRFHLAPMPGVLARLDAYSRKHSDSTDELADIIRYDMVLTLALLRLVNSPLYAGGRGEAPIGSVRAAVGIVGGRQLAGLAFAAGQMGSRLNVPAELSMTEFWRHSLMVAGLARSLAKRAGFEDPERYFTAGLLHDMGRLLLVERLGHAIAGVYGEASAQDIPFHVAETRALGFDHGAVGAAALQAWGVDARLVKAVREHHSQDMASDSPEYAAVVGVADFMARALGYVYWTDEHVLPPANGAWRMLGIPLGDIADVARDGYAEMERALFLFAAEGRTNRHAA
ncbi:HDOD domain-containing protein [Desulfovibrio subterraneus]|uniref:HDOD domain-containing protein n=1 Tax=Desulfovibrio subterraneus TaxID=2718620 RepID=UPI0022B8E52C|nr:HDOD domain-containing protein [Desulfovibrio subterraneus]WBF67287.1 HDOD domain-containing protein [Desulfovibrio subterraneus]